MKSLEQAFFNISMRLPIEDRKVQDRLERGKDILTNRGYTVKHIDGELYDVYRESTSLFEDNSIHYAVTVRSCTCPDYESARAGLCKHRLAVMIKVEMDT